MRGAVEVSELAADDLAAWWAIGGLAFGYAPGLPPQASATTAGMTRYAAVDADGRLVGRAVDRHHEQWWGGRRVVAADVAGVAVLPEARGRGVARALLGELLRRARERGAAVSALYPTVAAPYRDSSWEIGGVLRTVDVATASVPRHRPAAHLSVRPGGPADLPAVAELYQQIARPRNGMLTRQGPPFEQPTDALPAGVDGLTVVEDGTRLVGYAAWQRGTGYDAAAVLTVHELLAGTADAARELAGVLASWQSVAPTLRLRLLGNDALAPYLPLERAREYRQQVWMHRPVDVVRAVAGRGWPPYVNGSVEFAVEDKVAPWNAGAWRLEVADGAGHLSPATGEPALTLDVRGFALLYAGTTPATTLVEAGLLRCAPGHSPVALNLLGAGPPAQLLDYF